MDEAEKFALMLAAFEGAEFRRQMTQMVRSPLRVAVPATRKFEDLGVLFTGIFSGEEAALKRARGVLNRRRARRRFFSGR